MTFSSHASSLVVRFLGFSHLLIAIGSGACVVISLTVLGFAEDLLLVSAFISSCTGLGYSIQRFIKAKLFPSSVPQDRLEFLQKFGGWLVFIWSCVWIVGFAWVVEDLSIISWVVLVGLGVAVLWYSILPGPLTRWARSIREVPRMKLTVLSMVWGCATVVLPVLMVGGWEVVETGVLVGVVAARVLYISGLTIPFDVRDLNVDDENMRTIPMVWGVVNSLWLASALLGGASWVWVIIGELPLAFHSLITAILVSPKIYRPYRGEWYYSLLLDGMLLVQLFVLCS